MVKIIGYQKRTKKDGESFFVLNLLGGVEVTTSQNGKAYLSARKANMICPFDEETCKNVIGDKLPGTIEKQACTPYEYTIPQTGETVELDYSYVYNPTPSTLEEHVFEGKEQVTA